MNIDAAKQRLSDQLRSAMLRSGVSVDLLADKTKVPRSTISSWLGESELVLLPARVYLRGHFRLVARQLSIPDAEATALFDAAHPETQEPGLPAALPRIPRVSVVVSAGLVGVGILAIVLSLIQH